MSSTGIQLNRYELAFATEKIDGYLVSSPSKTDEANFLAAKADCLTHYRRYVAVIESLTFEQYQRRTRVSPPQRDVETLERELSAANGLIEDQGELIKRLQQQRDEALITTRAAGAR